MADSADPEPVAKPVAALVQYLNEKKAHSREKGKVVVTSPMLMQWSLLVAYVSADLKQGKSGKSYDKSSSRRQSKKKEVRLDNCNSA